MRAAVVPLTARRGYLEIAEKRFTAVARKCSEWLNPHPSFRRGDEAQENYGAFRSLRLLSILHLASLINAVVVVRRTILINEGGGFFRSIRKGIFRSGETQNADAFPKKMLAR